MGNLSDRMGDLADRFPWIGWAVIVGVEAVAFAIAAVLCHYGYLPWYLVPFSLVVPPVLAVFAVIAGLAKAESDGENMFE